MTRTRLCVVGADGRMGQEVLRTVGDEFEVTGAITHHGSPNEGRKLSDLNLPFDDVVIRGPESLGDALERSDVYLSFTTPEAELQNLPIAANMGKKIVLGTTGIPADQMPLLRSSVEGKTEAVFAANFSIGINFIAGLMSHIRNLPAGYDTSVVEIHHTGKADSPSGTALHLADIVKSARGYSKEVHGRSGKGKRSSDEIEILSVRAGGVPGVHDIIIAGPNEMITIEHTAFSRAVFAEGALLASSWLMKTNDKRVHSMREVLGV
ncbi:MAG TPA: 4-hydroxy-tetrahydrodipicolinate reductase [Thermoplasmata archaeon]|nr:4-hydroxy-tetrahydrodipicolinate reductase [Thermoplasmata archaeon]